MMFYRALQHFLFSFVLVFAIDTLVEGGTCSCGGERSSIKPCQAYGRASEIFIGRFLAGTRTNHRKDVGVDEAEYYGDLLFEIEKSFTGNRNRYVSAVNGWKCCDGPHTFKLGELYLVYLNQGQDKKLYTAETTKAIKFDKRIYDRIEDKWSREWVRSSMDPEADLEFLTTLPDRPDTVEIFGEVKAEYLTLTRKPRLVSDGLTGVTLRLKGEAGEYRIKTDENGAYTYKGLPQGKYQIEIEESTGYTRGTGTDRYMMEFNLRAGGCANADFYLDPAGQFQGRLVDSKGNPIYNRDVEILSSEWQEIGAVGERAVVFTARTDRDGRFLFYRLPPGGYLLGRFLQGSPENRIFYPAGADLRRAVAIHIGLGKNDEEVVFQMPE